MAGRLVTNMSLFRWTPKRDKAALALADGDTQEQAAKKAGVTRRTILRWLDNPEFSNEVDRLTFMTGVATRAGRLKIAKKVVQGRVENYSYPISKADLLDWLKFLQGETDGINLNLATLLEAYTQLAPQGPARIVEDVERR